MSADFFYGLNGFARNHEIVPCETDTYKVLFSQLTDFANRENATDSFSRTVLYPEEVTPEFTADLSDLQLTAVSDHSKTKIYPADLFYLDEVLGLILHNRNVKNSAAILTFSAMRSDTDATYLESLKGYKAGSLAKGDMYISQIQGPTFAQTKNNENLLKGIRWPFVLVSQAIHFSRQLGMPRVVIEPHEFNQWDIICENTRGTGSLRYDTTAERMGFSRDHEKSPYYWNNVNFQWSERN
jgi:hypothetical protein